MTTSEDTAINILVADGQSKSLNGGGGKGKTTAKVVVAEETLTHLEPIYLSLFDLDNY